MSAYGKNIMIYFIELQKQNSSRENVPLSANVKIDNGFPWIYLFVYSIASITQTVQHTLNPG
jgi:hypothetical protein